MQQFLFAFLIKFPTTDPCHQILDKAIRERKRLASVNRKQSNNAPGPIHHEAIAFFVKPYEDVTGKHAGFLIGSSRGFGSYLFAF